MLTRDKRTQLTFGRLDFTPPMSRFLAIAKGSEVAGSWGQEGE